MTNNNETIVKTLLCFTGVNGAEFKDKLVSKGMQRDIVDELMTVILSHVAEKITDPKHLN